MNKRTKSLLFVAAMGTAAGAQAYTVDGQLDDWLTNAPAAGEWYNGTMDWTANSGVNAVIEDDQANGYGGQTYDAEAIYTDFDDNYLYVAVVTGLPPTQVTWTPGDLAIYVGTTPFQLGTDTYNYGVETTGRVGALAPGNDTPAFDDSDVNQGDFFTNPSWATGYAGYDGEDTTSITDGTLVSGADVQIDYDTASEFWTKQDGDWNSHYVIEAAISRSLIGLSNNSNTMQYALAWTMNCGNDAIRISGSIPGQQGGNSVPEPAPLAILSLGLAALGYTRRRNAKR